MSPVIPHFASECSEILNLEKNPVWPKVNKELLIENEINIVIQINGKTRQVIKSDKNISENDLIGKVKDNLKLKSYLENKTIKKKIFIPGKLINILTN